MLLDGLDYLCTCGFHSDPLDITGLDICTGQGILEEWSLWVSHQKIIIIFNVFRHEFPEGGLVVIVYTACTRVLHVIDGRS